ncbi:MAG: motility protein A [Nitriliruptor sp.]|uniref:motility protein A n=1 Tax=Nitriliruptor sp. TaxID=2448056 RepID=UPI0034A057C6
MNPLVLGGLLAALAGIVLSTLMDGNSLGVLIGPSSFVLVFLGSVGAAVVSFDLADIKRAPGALLRAFKGSAEDNDATITTLVSMAEVARREGLLALEKRVEEIDDPFLAQGLQLLADGVDGDSVHEMLEIDIASLDERHRSMISLFESLGAYAPTFGMMGTVIGLINMLGNLSDPSQLGLGMSLALLTTLYGVLFANLLYLPIASRLKRLNAQELAGRDLALDAMLAIQDGTSPRRLVDRLEAFLPVGQRVGYSARMEGPAPVAEPVATEAA